MRRLALCLGLLLAAGAASSAGDFSSDALLRDHLWRSFKALPTNKRPKVGLVLSAGSLRATTHVGVIYALENAGFPVDVVAGTSMGAIVGSMYAAGRPVSRLWDIATHVRATSGSNLSAFSLVRLIVSQKLLSSAAAESFIRKEIGGKRFEDLPKPFACVAMDLYSGEPIIFREGDLASAVRASMNLPGVFTPVEYRHRYLVDGGVVDYIPVDAAKLLKADWTIASVAETDYTHSRPKNVLESLEQVIDIRGALLSRQQRKLANFLVEPAVGDIGLAEADRIPEAIEKGVIAGTKAVPGAEESLVLFSMDRLVPQWLPEPGR